MISYFSYSCRLVTGSAEGRSDCGTLGAGRGDIEWEGRRMGGATDGSPWAMPVEGRSGPTLASSGGNPTNERQRLPSSIKLAIHDCDATSSIEVVHFLCLQRNRNLVFPPALRSSCPSLKSPIGHGILTPASLKAVASKSHIACGVGHLLFM